VTETPLKISKPYDNFFWDKSNGPRKEESENSVNSGPLLP
jgi:hypothetical protein